MSTSPIHALALLRDAAVQALALPLALALVLKLVQATREYTAKSTHVEHVISHDTWEQYHSTRTAETRDATVH